MNKYLCRSVYYLTCLSFINQNDFMRSIFGEGYFIVNFRMKWLDKLFNTNALGQLTAYDKQSVLIRNCLQKFV